MKRRSGVSIASGVSGVSPLKAASNNERVIEPAVPNSANPINSAFKVLNVS